MRNRLALFVFASAAILGVAAHADTFKDYAFTATLTVGSAKGTVTFDETTGLITGGNITATDGINTYTFNHPSFASDPINSGVFDTVTYADFYSNDFEFQIALAGTDLRGYTGGPVCSTTNNAKCGDSDDPTLQYNTGLIADNGNGDANNATVGRLTPLVASAPEPSSMALFGTGLLSVAGIVRRRRR